MTDSNPPETIITRGSQLPLAHREAGSNKSCLVHIYPTNTNMGLVSLPERRFIIGRGEECDLHLVDSSVSRQHAAIEPHVGNFLIRDLQSTNGTFINDEPIERALLAPGDFVRIGSHIMKFLSSDHIEAQYHETIYAMMISDGLTGCSNKRHFLEALDRELVRSQRHRRPLSLVLFDLDHFKRVNDNYGHLAGDAVLREICARIRTTIRKDEVFARYGGEEFAVLLPESTLHDSVRFAERLRTIACETPICLNGLEIPVTISGGISCTQGEPDMTSERMIADADRKLYDAKQQGRNRILY